MTDQQQAEKTSTGQPGAPRAASSLPSSYISALLILGAVLAYFAIGTLMAGDDAPEDIAAAERAPFRVLVTQVAPEARAVTVQMSGRSEAGRRVIVRAETPGQVLALPVAEGTMVDAGATLCRLDPDSRTAVRAEAEAALVKAQTDYEGAKRLFDEGFSSDAALKSAAAARDGALARVSQARQDLSNILIKAPFAGLVAETLVEPGDVLTTGGGCAVVADLTDIVIAGGLPARQATLLSVGDPAQVKIDGQAPFAAEVTFVSDVADMNTRAFRIELKAKNASGLSDGLDARATITAGTATAAAIPHNALVFSDNGELGVRTLNIDAEMEKGEVVFIPVTLVGETVGGAFVTGLEGPTHLIIRGQDYVMAGTEVAYTLDTDEKAN